MIPPGITPGMVVGVGGCNVRKLGRIAECYVKVDKKKVSSVRLISSGLPNYSV